MKKTLIALAAVAATTGAMAQVTLSGSLSFGYESTQDKSAAGVVSNKKQGLRSMDGNIRLTATEDLGGGLKVTVSTQIDSQGRGPGTAVGTVGGEDASITISGGFGSVLIGQLEAGNGIVGLGQAGAPVRGFDNTGLIAAASNVNLLRYTSPAMNGFTFNIDKADNVGAGGMESGSSTGDLTAVGVRYSAGPLQVAADFTDVQRNNQAYSGLMKDRTRISASYDFGVVRVGFGREQRDIASSATASAKTTDQIFGISAPLGNGFTVGLVRGESKVGTAAKAKGTEYGVRYDLSKRTWLAFQVNNYKNADGSKKELTRVRLNTSF